MRRKSFSFIQSISVLLVFELFAFTYPIYAQDLSGKVYEGQTGTEPPPLGNAKPIEGVTVSLYGSGDENDDGTGMGRDPIQTTTTNSEGWYSLTPRGAYDFYNIVQTNKADYIDSGATSVGGTVKSSNWIQYRYEDIFVTPVTMTGNKFWDKKEGQEPPANNRPVAQDDSATTSQYTAVDIDVLFNDTDPDGDPLQIISVTSPTWGTTVNHVTYVTYIPSPVTAITTFTDTFDYTVGDGKGGTDTAMVTVTVQEGGEPPADEFIYQFEGPSKITGTAGTKVTQDFYVTLTNSVPVEGWVIAAGSSDVALISFVDADVTNTVAAAPFAELVVYTIYRPEGATCGVILDFEEPHDAQTLDPDPQGQAHKLLRVTVEATMPVVPATVTLEFVDDVLGDPRLSNVVVVNGLSVSPQMIPKTITLEPSESPSGEEWDLGDAPEGRGYNYPTTRANNGARHRIVRNGPWLGDSSNKPDPEPDGQPDSNAQGDDVDGNDDESDHSWSMCQGKPGRMYIEVGERGGHVDVWIDFNGDGIWQHPQERVLSQYLPYYLLTYSFTVPVPIDSIIGTTFARFRINSTGPLPPYGPADDGEVEDDSLFIHGVDYGDAPDPPYPTLNASGAPWLAVSGLMLGTLVDPESDGQPDPNALGDDNDGTNDDDGVTFKTKLIPNQEATVEVLCSGNFTSSDLHGWIDFNQNGIWETTEEIINTSGVASGIPDTYKFTVPNGAKLGLTYARFIISAIIQATCECDIFGEIEDYAVVIGEDGPYPPTPQDEWDFGDAPDSYKTLKASGGPCHKAGPLTLGRLVDIESEGVPSPDALGDDNAGMDDDEDGIVDLTELNLTAGQPGVIHVTVANSEPVQNNGTVVGWIDFDGDGQFNAAPECIGVQAFSLGGGGTIVLLFPFVVPANATGTTCVRFRLYRKDMPTPPGVVEGFTHAGVAGGTGEVEDYIATILAVVSPDDRDYGDAPYDGIATFYPSANHQVGGPWWGDFSDLPDVESGMQRNNTATGDDADTYGDDENGLFGANLVQGQGGGLYVSFVPGGSGEVTLHGWVDLNGDGDWDDADEVSGPWAMALGPIPTGGWPNPINIILPFTVPAQAQVGQTFARLRIEEGLLGAVSHTGPAGAGEVEDHLVEIKASGSPVPSSGMIWGIKFEDLNGNGIWESTTELVLPNWTIWLDSNQNGGRDAGDTTVLTDGLGMFQFSGLAPGTYLVGEDEQAGWTQTWPAAPGTHTVRVQSSTAPWWGILFGNQHTGAGLSLDWGDAPDPNYPTLRSSNGAYHVIVPGIFLGGGVDPDADGQPAPDARGDDYDGSDDDEDGVTFITPLIPGQQASVEVMASVGYLDAWIDFDADGNWSQASDQIFQSKFIVAAGSYVLNFQVPSDAATDVDTYARFRFSSTGALSPYGPAQDGEVEDYHILLGEDGPDIPVGDEQPHVKWSQPPIEIDPNLEEAPVFCGWDEPARSTEQTGERRQWRMDADDFRCLGPIPITRIRWWGGYKAWTSPEPPELQPEAWHIGIWANQVEGVTQDESFPERMVWSLQIPAERIHFEPVGHIEFPQKLPETCFLYEVALEPEEWFHQVAYESNYDIFWISITAIYPADAEAKNMWGWTTRPHLWGHGAVMPAIMGDWPTFDERLFPGRIYPIENSLLCGRNQAYDLCFELLTEQPWVKWDQPFTGIRDWPGYTDGMSMALEPEGGELSILRQVADDWLCERKDPVTAMAWNGSYIGYGYEACKCYEVPEPLKPDYFLLSIWSDTSGADFEHDNHPGEKIWEYKAYDYDEVLAGYDRNPETEPNEPVFRYSVRLPEEAWFRQPATESIYWFSVVAVYNESIDEIPCSWGWTNHSHTFGSPALTRDDSMSMILQWQPPLSPDLWPADMSFIFFTAPEFRR